MQLKPIAQQVVAVVGASSGIGRETALQFAQRGAKVVAAARNQVALNSLLAEIQQSGGEATIVIADVADFEQVQAIAAKAIEQYGRLDTWVQNAAVDVFAPFEETSVEEFRRVMDVNFMGHVYAVKAALPHLKQFGGALIHITSMEAVRALPLQSAYSASKHAVSGLVESLRVEFAHDHVPVSITEVQPSGVNTPLFDKSLTRLGVKPQATPPLYSPKAVAEAILYAAEHPIRDIVVGEAGKILDLLQRVSPPLVDTFLTLIGLETQKTSEPKSADAPNNLYTTLDGFDRSEGDLQHKTMPSLTTFLDTQPALKWGTVATVGALALAVLANQTLVRK